MKNYPALKKALTWVVIIAISIAGYFIGTSGKKDFKHKPDEVTARNIYVIENLKPAFRVITDTLMNVYSADSSTIERKWVRDTFYTRVERVKDPKTGKDTVGLLIYPKQFVLVDEPR